MQGCRFMNSVSRFVRMVEHIGRGSEDLRRGLPYLPWLNDGYHFYMKEGYVGISSSGGGFSRSSQFQVGCVKEFHNAIHY